MCCNIHGLILYLAKVALVAVELCEFALVWVSVCFFFSSVSCIFAVRLVSVLLRCRRFLPWDPAGSNTITVKSLMSQLIWKKIQTNNKKATRKLFDYFYWANFYKAAIFFNNNKSAYFLFIPFLFSFQKKRKETRHMKSGVVSLVIMKLPYCLCRELVVSVEPCDCFSRPSPPECAFPTKDQNRFFFKSLCCLCMYLNTCWKSHNLQRNLTSEILSEVFFGFYLFSVWVHGLYNASRIS